MAQNTLLVSYDLIWPETSADYNNLIKKITTGYITWARPLESFWFIKTEKTVSTVVEELRLHMDANDKLVVIDITGDFRTTLGIDNDVSVRMKQNM